MMKYKSKYLLMFTVLLKKHLKAQYGDEITKKALKGAPDIYREMLNNADDIGADNPMAPNLYMCFVFLAIWKAADGAIDVESFRKVIINFIKSPLVNKILGGRDMNKPKDLQKAEERFHKMQEWADTHPQYKDKTWDFNFDETKHKDGTYYHFTRCPIEAFARKYGYLEVLPICCDIDYLSTEANHGVLHRSHTLATGGEICDYWIVPDEIKDPE